MRYRGFWGLCRRQRVCFGLPSCFDAGVFSIQGFDFVDLEIII